MRKQLIKLTYWVMYEERVRKQNETEFYLKKTQHYGTSSLATAQISVDELQQHVDAKTHFWSNAPEGHYLTRAWLECEMRYLLPDSIGANEANPATENSTEEKQA